MQRYICVSVCVRVCLERAVNVACAANARNNEEQKTDVVNSRSHSLMESRSFPKQTVPFHLFPLSRSLASNA